MVKILDPKTLKPDAYIQDGKHLARVTFVRRVGAFPNLKYLIDTEDCLTLATETLNEAQLRKRKFELVVQGDACLDPSSLAPAA